MERDIQEILIPAHKIKEKVMELGARISHDYQGKDLVIVGILKGALIFMADLVRAITIPAVFDFMAVSSYGNAAVSSGAVRILKDLDKGIENKHVLIVEDIIDTGLTLRYLVDNLKSRGPSSVRVCTLLDKPERRKIEVEVHYNGFVVPDYFLVGYGLDFNEKYRNLPDVCILKPEVYR